MELRWAPGREHKSNTVSVSGCAGNRSAEEGGISQSCRQTLRGLETGQLCATKQNGTTSVARVDEDVKVTSKRTVGVAQSSRWTQSQTEGNLPPGGKVYRN